MGGDDAIPDETAIRNFRRWLKTHQLAEELISQVNAHLASKGLRLRGGTSGDATLIAAPRSTTNRSGQRDGQMHLTKIGNQWYFAMKAHSGEDDESCLVHHVHCTAAHVADGTQVDRLLHGEADTVWEDSGPSAADKRQELEKIAAGFLIAAWPSQVRAIKNRKDREAAWWGNPPQKMVGIKSGIFSP